LNVNPQFNLPETYIGPGEMAASQENIIISTLLGSCIAVALFDHGVPAGGLNHFMLPFPKTGCLFSESARYGIHAMELLINDLLKMGVRRERLRSKVFGGGAVLEYRDETVYNVPKKNIEFIFDFLKLEKIPIDSYSVGGTLPRKVVFFPTTGRALMRFTHKAIPSLNQRETQYSQELLKNCDGKNPVLFTSTGIGKKSVEK